MNEVVLNGEKKVEGVTWDQLEPGQLAEIVGSKVDSPNVYRYMGRVVQILWWGNNASMGEIGSENTWGKDNPYLLRPLEPGETVTITVK